MLAIRMASHVLQVTCASAHARQTGVVRPREEHTPSWRHSVSSGLALCCALALYVVQVSDQCANEPFITHSRSTCSLSCLSTSDVLILDERACESMEERPDVLRDLLTHHAGHHGSACAHPPTWRKLLAKLLWSGVSPNRRRRRRTVTHKEGCQARARARKLHSRPSSWSQRKRGGLRRSPRVAASWRLTLAHRSVLATGSAAPC